MSQAFARVKVGDTEALFEIEDVAAERVGPEQVMRVGDRVVVDLDEQLTDLLDRVKPTAETLVEGFKSLSPHQTTIEFGIDVDGQLGAVFARAGVAAHFNVTLSWTRS